MGMKKLIVATVFTGLFLSMSSTQRDKQLYQVISSHPHDLKEMASHIETVHQSGRLWIVDLKAGAPAEVREHLRPITGREKSYLYNNLGLRFKNIGPRGGDMSGRSADNQIIMDTVGQVDSELIKQDVLELTSYTTRAAGTPENQAVTKSVADKFLAMNYAVKEICYRPAVCSVIAEKKGRSKSQEVLLVLAHMDSVGKEFAGADDNASGTATLLEIARVLKDYDNEKTIRFFATNGEENGLLGAEHYVALLKASGEIKQLSLAVNMDMVGYNKNGIVELETNPNLEELAKWYAGLASQYTKLRTKITLGAWGSDHVPFLDAGAPALLTIEDWSTKTPCYHMGCDKPDTLNYQYAGEIAKLNAAAVMSKDKQ